MRQRQRWAVAAQTGLPQLAKQAHVLEDPREFLRRGNSQSDLPPAARTKEKDRQTTLFNVTGGDLPVSVVRMRDRTDSPFAGHARTYYAAA